MATKTKILQFGIVGALVLLFNNCGQEFKSIHFQDLGSGVQSTATPSPTPTPTPVPSTPRPTPSITPIPPSPVPGETLGEIASKMAGGTWAKIPNPRNMVDVFAHGGHTGNLLPYAMNGVWDPISKRFHFLGGDHGEPSSRHVYYDEPSNSWVDLGFTGFGGVHGYNHLAIDTANRQMYFNPYGYMDNGTYVHRYSLVTQGPWVSLGQYPATGYVNVTHGVSWFDKMDGAGPTGALVIYNCGEPNGELSLYDPTSNKWFANVKGFGGESTYHCYMHYSKVHNVAIMGGGSNSKKVWRLNPDRSVTAIADPPIDLGIQDGNVSHDPVSGNFLAMGYGQLWELDPRGSGKWTQQTGPPAEVGNPGSPNLNGVISSPISNYGVTLYVTCRATNCNMYIYKH